MSVTFPAFIPGDPIRVSATTYLAWKRCPDSANVRLQGRYSPDSRPAFLGSLAHRVFSRHLSTGPISSDEFVQACREEIGGSALNHKLSVLELRPSALAGVIEEVRALYERFVNLSDVGFEGTEVDLRHQAEEDVELVGTVDAVYTEAGGRRLVDWKTGELGQPGEQLLFYALLWALREGELPGFVEAVSVRTGERYRTVPTTQDVVRVAAEVATLVNQVRDAWLRGVPLERHGGPWCAYCPILEECEEGKSAEALLS